MLSSCVLLALCPSLALADDWINPGTGDWFLGSNWADGTVPAAVDDANIDNGGTANVSAFGALSNNVFVGKTNSGFGQLTITNGGLLSNFAGSIGQDARSIGQVTVNGSSAKWDNLAILSVARSGSGTLTISNGGSVLSSGGFIGYIGIGSVTLSGVGSSWINSDDLMIGAFGNGDGRLDIYSGGKVRNRIGTVGNSNGTSGTVLVDGPSSTWENGSELVIGGSGAGSLNIVNFATVSVDGGAGTLTLSKFSGNGAGRGELNIGNGGDPGILQAAKVVGGFGVGVVNFYHSKPIYSFTTDGTESGLQISIGGTANVNQLGVGMTILSGANTYAGTTSVGAGKLVVTGSINSVSSFTVGTMGAAEAAISDGGTVRSANGLLGRDVGSIGHMDVSGNGSMWITDGELVVGREGTGSLLLRNGGSSRVGVDGGQFFGDLVVGEKAGGTGTMIVEGPGSRMDAARWVLVGDEGNGQLDIIRGGSVISNGGTIGFMPSGQGTVTVDGLKSEWVTASSILVGHRGNGQLSIYRGGQIISGDGHIGGVNDGDFGSGLVIVDGMASKWSAINGAFFNIGEFGPGVLHIRNGGAVEATNARLGGRAGVSGELTVDGPESTFISTSGMDVGVLGKATLNITAGGRVKNSFANVSGSAGAESTVTVSGIGSRWEIDNSQFPLLVGGRGIATLSVQDGGTVSVGAGVGTITLAKLPESTGTINIGGSVGAGFLDIARVDGVGTALLNFDHDNANYVFSNDGTFSGAPIAVGGSTAINHNGSGTTFLYGTNTYTGATTVNNGLLRVDGSITSTSAVNVVRGALTLENGGELTVGNGAGTFFLGSVSGGDGTLNIGSGGPIGVLKAAAVGSLTPFPGPVVNFNHDNPDYVFSTTGTSSGAPIGISGTTAVNQIGPGRTTLAGNHTYTGETTIDGGTMRIIGAVTATSRLDVGETGSGVLHIENGGTIYSRFGSIGTNVGSIGSVLIDGSNAVWTIDSLLDVAPAGRGTLTIQNGGRISGDLALASVGMGVGSQGIVTVDGASSSWSNNILNIGGKGIGSLVIRGGGSVKSSTGWIGLGRGDGSVLVDGPGSTWTDIAALTVGTVGTGSLSIRNGGVVNDINGNIGQSIGSVGTVTVDGAGSRWVNSGMLSIASVGGAGTLLVTNDGVVTAQDVSIGLSSAGVVTIDGHGSALLVGGSLSVGITGSGALNVVNGGAVSSSSSNSGSPIAITGIGTITVDGSGSSWTNNGATVRLTRGSIVLQNGGKHTIASGSGTIQLEALGSLNIDGSTGGVLNAGTVTGNGAATLNFEHSNSNYSFTKDATSNGEPVLIKGGTTVNQTGSGATTLTGAHSYTGATTINAGTLRVNGSITSNTSVNSGGTLGGSGTVAAVNVANGGALAPGSVVGTLTTGALSLANGSRLNFELGAPGATSDLLVVNGGLVLDGVLNVQAMAGFAPGTYRLINYSGSLTDNQLSVGSLPAGFVAAIDTTTPGQVNLAVTSGRPAGNQAPSGEVTITGTPREGLTVHAVDTLADADGLGAFSYQWFVGDAMASGANSATLTLDDLKVGKMLRVVVSYTDGQGFSEQISSAAVGPVAPAGTDLPFQKRLFFVNPADNPNQQTFIRLVNPNDADVAVQIQGYDDNGTPAPGGEVVLMLSAQQSLQLNAADLELGNAGKGLDGALGNGVGKWQLKVNSSAPIEAMSLIRTPDGFLTSVTETVPTEAAGVHVLYFANPGSNPNQQSFIRVVNRSGASGEVNVSAVDDAGIPAPGGDIRFTLAANAALNFNAEDYTNGNPAKSLQGAFGTGTGKWQLTVSSALNLEVMSLIRTPDGFLTDLSNIAPRAASGDDSDRLLLSVVSGNNADQQGLIRLVNRGGLAENVTLSAIDDTGIRAPTSAVVEVAPFAAVQLLASDLEQGNPAKGLTGAFGSGEGRWQINATPQARVEAQSLLRVPGGFLTNLSASAPRESQFEARLWIFNPGSNDQQRSILRLINRSDTSGVALIEAVDDLGQPAPGGSISVDLAPRTAVELDALELEVGNPAKGLIGALGDGNGKWRLRISADVTIEVQGLLETPTGFLTNLSSTVH